MTDKQPTTVDDIAPYPRTEQDVTAEVLVRRAAVEAVFRHQRAQRHCLQAAATGTKADLQMSNESVAALFAELGNVLLLRALVEHAPEQADAVAREFWHVLADGSDIDAWLGEWLTEYGVDPEAVNRVGEAQSRQREQALAEQKTP